MGNGENFNLKALRIAGVVFVLTLLIANASCQMTNQRITDMVEAGADPIEAACAVSAANIDSTLCDKYRNSVWCFSQ